MAEPLMDQLNDFDSRLRVVEQFMQRQAGAMKLAAAIAAFVIGLLVAFGKLHLDTIWEHGVKANRQALEVVAKQHADAMTKFGEAMGDFRADMKVQTKINEGFKEQMSEAREAIERLLERFEDNP